MSEPTIEELIDAVIWAAWFDENSLREEGIMNLIGDLKDAKTTLTASNAELLAACEAALSAMEMQEGRETEAFHIPQESARSIWYDAKIKTRAAIAKAEGQPEVEPEGDNTDNSNLR